MKKIPMILALLLALSLGLTALAEAPALPQREETINLEGTPETFLATQYTLPGRFSLWYAAADFEPVPLDNGTRFQLLNNFLDAEVFLEVALAAEPGQPADHLLAEAQTAYQQEGWQIAADPAQITTLADAPMPGFIAAKDNQTAQVYLITLGTGTYQVTLRYPMEAAEGWGARMHHYTLTIDAAQ